MKTLQISKKKFCDWYFDTDTSECLTEGVIKELITTGKTTLTLQALLKNIGYIPTYIVINKKDINKDDITGGVEIEEPNATYKLELVMNK